MELAVQLNRCWGVRPGRTMLGLGGAHVVCSSGHMWRRRAGASDANSPTRRPPCVSPGPVTVRALVQLNRQPASRDRSGTCRRLTGSTRLHRRAIEDRAACSPPLLPVTLKRLRRSCTRVVVIPELEAALRTNLIRRSAERVFIRGGNLDADRWRPGCVGLARQAWVVADRAFIHFQITAS